MATLSGNNGVVKVANAVGSPTAVASVRNFSIDIVSDTIETTTMGSEQRTYIKGLSSWSGTADVYFDGTNYASIPALNPTGVLVGSAPIAVEFYLDGSTNKFAGNAVITGFTVNTSMDGMVEASLSLQGSGVCTFS